MYFYRASIFIELYTQNIDMLWLVVTKCVEEDDERRQGRGVTTGMSQEPQS